jgi:hypothetical protein
MSAAYPGPALKLRTRRETKRPVFGETSLGNCAGQETKAVPVIA